MQAEVQNPKREFGKLLARIAKSDPTFTARAISALEGAQNQTPFVEREMQAGNSCANGESNGVINSGGNGVLKEHSEDSEMESLTPPPPDSAKHSPNFSLQNSGGAPKPHFSQRGRGSLGKRGYRQEGESATAPDFLGTGREIREFKNRLTDRANVARNVPGLYMEGRAGARAKISPGLIRGGYAICAYVGVDRRTLEKWIREFDFPAAHLPDGCYVTTPMLVDAWVAVAIERERERFEKMPELRQQYLKGMQKISGFRPTIQTEAERAASREARER